MMAHQRQLARQRLILLAQPRQLDRQVQEHRGGEGQAEEEHGRALVEDAEGARDGAQQGRGESQDRHDDARHHPQERVLLRQPPAADQVEDEQGQAHGRHGRDDLGSRQEFHGGLLALRSDA
jgi:hypothetical protein